MRYFLLIFIFLGLESMAEPQELIINERINSHNMWNIIRGRKDIEMVPSNELRVDYSKYSKGGKELGGRPPANHLLLFIEENGERVGYYVTLDADKGKVLINANTLLLDERIYKTPFSGFRAGQIIQIVIGRTYPDNFDSYVFAGGYVK